MAKANGNKAAMKNEDLAVMPHLTAEDVAALPNFSEWSEEQIGFAPYWTPVENAWLYAVPVKRDDRDPEFVRYLMRAIIPTACKRGPNEEAEEVIVRPGEHFTMSVYYSLQDAFDQYLTISEEKSVDVPIHVTAVKKVPTKTSGQKVWQFKVKVAPETKALLDGFRTELKQLSTDEKNERRALQA